MYKLAKDVVIPAGTELGTAAPRTERCDINGNPAIASGKPAHFVSAIIGPTPDTVFEWTMHIDDALEAGLSTPA